MYRLFVSYFLLGIFLQSVALFPLANGNSAEGNVINSFLELTWEVALGYGDSTEGDAEDNMPVGAEEEVKCDYIDEYGSLSPIHYSLLKTSLPFNDEGKYQHWLETIAWPPEYLS